jgi:hypothetical protein
MTLASEKEIDASTLQCVAATIPVAYRSRAIKEEGQQKHYDAIFETPLSRFSKFWEDFMCSFQ